MKAQKEDQLKLFVKDKEECSECTHSAMDELYCQRICAAYFLLTFPFLTVVRYQLYVLTLCLCDCSRR